MPKIDESDEAQFKQAIRRFIAAGRHPSKREVLLAVGRPEDRMKFGLTSDQTKWRIDEVEAAGFDWNASKRAGQLVPRISQVRHK